MDNDIERISELEIGFAHLLEGLRAVLQDLRAENALLRARLEERRLMTTLVQPVVEAPIALRPVAVTGLRRHIRNFPPKPCQACGRDFLPNGTTQLVCSQCRQDNPGVTAGELIARKHA